MRGRRGGSASPTSSLLLFLPDGPAQVTDASPTLDRAFVILGGSSAIGKALAHAAAASGQTVLLAGRDVADIEATAADIELRHGHPCAFAPWDAADIEAQAEFAADCAAQARVLTVALCVGNVPSFSLLPPPPETTARLAHNGFTCVAAVLAAFAHQLVARRGSQLVVFSDPLEGWEDQQADPVAAARMGIAAFTLGLNARLAPSGVHAMLVETPPVDTAMTWGQSGAVPSLTPEAVAAEVMAALAKPERRLRIGSAARRKK